jgi:hypothetical protein
MWFEVPKEFRKTPEAIEMLRIDAEFSKSLEEELKAVHSRLWEKSLADFEALNARTNRLHESLGAAVKAYDLATGEPKCVELPQDLAAAVAEQFDTGDQDRVIKVLSKTLAILRRQRSNDPRIGFCILKLASGDARLVEDIARDACIDYRDIIIAADGMTRHSNQ